MKHSTYILFNQEKIPLFSQSPVPKELIEKSIVLGINRIKDTAIQKRIRQLVSVQVKVTEEAMYIDLYDTKGKSCRLEVLPSFIGSIVQPIKEKEE